MALDIGMTCSCEAHFSVSTTSRADTDAAWFLAHRFANGHVDCGYMKSPFSLQDPDSVEVSEEELAE